MPLWNIVKLGDVAEVQNGYAFKAGDMKDFGIPIIKIKNIQPPNISLEDTEYYANELNQRLKQFLIRRKDILISMTGSHLSQLASAVGKVGRYNSDKLALLNQRVGKVFSKDNTVLDNEFLYYYISRLEIQIELATNAGGSANQANISPQHIKDLEIELPKLPTQTRIASILSAFDDKIELNHQMNHTLEQMAQALFKKYFVDDIDPENLPEGWRMGKLGDVITTKGGTTPSTSVREYWDGNVHWTSPKDLSNYKFPVLLNTEKRITESGLAKISSGLLPIGTLLLSSRAPIGYLAITQIPVAINQGYIAIVCDKMLSNYFMLYWLKYNMDIIERNANGSTFMEISKSVFRNIDIAIPPNSVLGKFDNIVSNLFCRIVNNEIENETLTKLRDTLLPKLMSGEVNVEQAAATA